MKTLSWSFITAILAAFIILSTLIGIAFFQVGQGTRLLMATLLLAFLATSQAIIILQMTRTGRMRAKGAKRRRKQLFPFVYQRKRRKYKKSSSDMSPAI
jgi:hypothetical protein